MPHFAGDSRVLPVRAMSLRARNLRALVLWTSFACITSIQSAFTLDDVFNPAFVPRSVAAQWVSGADAVLTYLSEDGDIFAYTVGGTPWLLLNASSDVGPMLLKAERRVLACHSGKPSHFDSDMLAREPCVAAGSVIARYEVSADLQVRMPWLRVQQGRIQRSCAIADDPSGGGPRTEVAPQHHGIVFRL